MNDADAPAPPIKRRSLKSIAVIALLVMLLCLFGWWYLFGGGGVLSDVFSRPADTETTIVPVEPLPPQMQANALIEERLERLETLALSLDETRRAQKDIIGSLEGFARSEDLQASSSRLRAEIRALRASFPEAAALERSQMTLAWHLLQLAEMEHRLFGDTGATASLLERAGHLLRDHPTAIDLMVDLARLEQELRESQALGVLKVSEKLTAMGELATRVPLLRSEYKPMRENSSGILRRVGAGLRSLVRIERLNSANPREEISRIQLALELERMQVAVLRRDGPAFGQHRARMVAWLEGHAQTDHQDARELLSHLSDLEEVDLGVQTADFAALLSRVEELAK